MQLRHNIGITVHFEDVHVHVHCIHVHVHCIHVHVYVTRSGKRYIFAQKFEIALGYC